MAKYDIVIYKGFKFDRYTVRAIKWVEKNLPFDISFAQGSYNAGGVQASAGTHDGGGAVDIRVFGLNDQQIRKMVNTFKDAGFAAWYRKAIPGLWGPHVHAILIDNIKAASGAKSQVVAYDNHRDGLRGNAWDATYRPDPKVKFSYLLRKPVKRR